MSLLTPDIGLLFWMLLSFTIVMFVLKKFAWKPIMEAVKARENSISSAINAAKHAREELEQLQEEKDKAIDAAKQECDKIIKDGRELVENYMTDAKTKSTQKANKLLEDARAIIKRDKIAAINQVKDYIAEISVQIAEKLIKQELDADNKQKMLIDKMVNEINFN